MASPEAFNPFARDDAHRDLLMGASLFANDLSFDETWVDEIGNSAELDDFDHQRPSKDSAPMDHFSLLASKIVSPIPEEDLRPGSLKRARSLPLLSGNRDRTNGSGKSAKRPRDSPSGSFAESLKMVRQEVARLLNHQQNSTRQTAEIQDDTIIMRKTIVQSFLEFWCSDMRDVEKWEGLLDPKFILTQSLVPLFGAVAGSSANGGVKGVPGVLVDVAFMTDMIRMVDFRVKKLKPHFKGNIRFNFRADPSEMLVVDEKLMCHWQLRSRGLRSAGFPNECFVDGMMKCKFNGNKLISCEIFNEISSFTQQLQNFSLV